MENSSPPRWSTKIDVVRRVVSIFVLVAMVSSAAARVLSLLEAALLATAILILTGCLTVEQAFASIKGRVLLAIVSAFGVGAALENTNVAESIADSLVGLGSNLGGVGLLIAIFICASVLSCLISNAATVVIMFPIINAVDFNAVDGNLTRRMLFITLLMAVSSPFASPIGSGNPNFALPRPP